MNCSVLFAPVRGLERRGASTKIVKISEQGDNDLHYKILDTQALGRFVDRKAQLTNNDDGSVWPQR